MSKITMPVKFDKRLAKLPAAWQKRILSKIQEIAGISHESAQSDGSYEVGDWQIAYERHKEELVILDLRDAAKRRMAQDEEERVPFELVERRVAGEPPLRIWREYRKLTQAMLAKRSGVSRVMIAAIEAGTKQGSVATLKKLARTLNVDIEQLV